MFWTRAAIDLMMFVLLVVFLLEAVCIPCTYDRKMQQQIASQGTESNADLPKKRFQWHFFVYKTSLMKSAHAF